MRIVHHFGPKNTIRGVDVGTYIKATTFGPGEEVPMHEHTHSHQSVLCSGWALVTIDGESEEMRGPAILEITAGKAHTVKALTSILWLCVHATDETDPDKIDETLVG